MIPFFIKENSPETWYENIGILKFSFTDQKNKQKKIKSLKNRISKLEKQIEQIDESHKELDLQLSDPDKFKELSQKEGFFEQYEKDQQKKHELVLEWEQTVDN